MTTRGVRPENEIFIMLLIVFVLLFSTNKPKLEQPRVVDKVDTVVSLNIQRNFSAKSAEISEELKEELIEIAERIDEKSIQHEFDGIEIIGHADTVTVGKLSYRGYNLDNALANYLGTDLSLDQAESQFQSGSYLAENTASNTELAMIRAVVVTQFFRKLKQEGRLFQHIEFFVPMSAGAMVDTDYRLDTSPTGKNESDRRRIEFQLFSSSDRSSGSEELKVAIKR